MRERWMRIGKTEKARESERMEEQWITILAGILMIAVYVGAPVLLILGLFKWRKHRKMKDKTGDKKPYKIISVPLLVLNATPACGIVLRENAVFNLERTSEEFWYIVITLCFAVEVVITLIQCKWRGIWISMVRFLAGTALGIAAGNSIVIFFGLCLVLMSIMAIGGSSGSGSETIAFRKDDGTYVLLRRSGMDKHYYDSDTGDTYRVLDTDRVLNETTHRDYKV